MRNEIKEEKNKLVAQVTSMLLRLLSYHFSYSLQLLIVVNVLL